MNDNKSFEAIRVEKERIAVKLMELSEKTFYDPIEYEQNKISRNGIDYLEDKNQYNFETKEYLYEKDRSKNSESY